MAKIRRILALVLVMAMTFTMLPVFAAAEDVVSEIPAVETVEAPAAEAPVVEAPADAPVADAPVVEAPVVDVPAVEDVVEIPTEAPVEEPAVEAIETVAAETVAELQEAVASGATYTNGVQSTGQTDSDAVAAGYIAKLVHTLGTEDASDDEVYFYTSLPDAITDACAWTATGGTVYLLTDYTYLSTSAKNPFAVWTGNPDYSSEGGVNGFWFDLNGKTLIARKPGALFGYNKNFQSGAGYAVTPWLNIRNGKVFHFNQSGTSGTSSSIDINLMGSVQFGFSYWANASSSAPNYGIAYPHLTLKDVEYALLSIGNDMPLFNTLAWNASIDLYDSKFINASLNESGNADDGTQSGSAICIIPSMNMRPSTYKTDSTKAATLVGKGETGNYTINLHGTSVLGSLHATKPVVHYD
ncbi:MAG: hypothetical protein IKA78_01995, partial [Oscillospiraceae bacterium]|nr:hypothetical protein [Oscillospiraceae bacterium]